MKPYVDYSEVKDPNANSYQAKRKRKSKNLIPEERQGHLNRMKKSYKTGYHEKELMVPIVKIPCPESFITGPDTLKVGESGIFQSRTNLSFNSFDIQSAWNILTPSDMGFDQKIIDSIPPYEGKESSLPVRFAKDSGERRWSSETKDPVRRWSDGGSEKTWDANEGKKRWEGQQEKAEDTGTQEGFCRAEFTFNKAGMVRLDITPIIPGLDKVVAGAPKHIMITGVGSDPPPLPTIYAKLEYYKGIGAQVSVVWDVTHNCADSLPPGAMEIGSDLYNSSGFGRECPPSTGDGNCHMSSPDFPTCCWHYNYSKNNCRHFYRRHYNPAIGSGSDFISTTRITENFDGSYRITGQGTEDWCDGFWGWKRYTGNHTFKVQSPWAVEGQEVKSSNAEVCYSGYVSCSGKNFGSAYHPNESDRQSRAENRAKYYQDSQNTYIVRVSLARLPVHRDSYLGSELGWCDILAVVGSSDVVGLDTSGLNLDNLAKNNDFSAEIGGYSANVYPSGSMHEADLTLRLYKK